MHYCYLDFEAKLICFVNILNCRQFSPNICLAQFDSSNQNKLRCFMLIQLVYRRLALANKHFDENSRQQFRSVNLLLCNTLIHAITSLPLSNWRVRLLVLHLPMKRRRSAINQDISCIRQVKNSGCKLVDFRLFIAAHCIRSSQVSAHLQYF